MALQIGSGVTVVGVYVQSVYVCVCVTQSLNISKFLNEFRSLADLF